MKINRQKGITMLPIDNIRPGNQFQNPLFRGWGIVWYVEEVKEKERMIKLQGYSYPTCSPVGTPIWKKNTDRMFSESWRIN